jgi:hypothetical protein
LGSIFLIIDLVPAAHAYKKGSWPLMMNVTKKMRRKDQYSSLWIKTGVFRWLKVEVTHWDLAGG